MILGLDRTPLNSSMRWITGLHQIRLKVSIIYIYQLILYYIKVYQISCIYFSMLLLEYKFAIFGRIIITGSLTLKEILGQQFIPQFKIFFASFLPTWLIFARICAIRAKCSLFKTVYTAGSIGKSRVIVGYMDQGSAGNIAGSNTWGHPHNFIILARMISAFFRIYYERMSNFNLVYNHLRQLDVPLEQNLQYVVLNLYEPWGSRCGECCSRKFLFLIKKERKSERKRRKCYLFHSSQLLFAVSKEAKLAFEALETFIMVDIPSFQALQSEVLYFRLGTPDIFNLK